MSGALALEGVDGAARAGWVTTPHGRFATPAFMPVGTHATVKTLHPDEVRTSGAGILLCNAYHLMLRPGVELVERAGGLHSFMGWDGPILTDSGGYQLVSLRDVARVEESGATFVSPWDGSRLAVTPEQAVTAQARLGADIIMCLDHPVAWGTSPARELDALERTHRWAARCRAVRPDTGQLLFGIAQGGFDAGRRRHSAEVVGGLDFDGVALGGLSLGEPLAVMEAMAAATVSGLPADRPRYFMGLGTDAELLAMVGLGIDMFDCVAPTRLARSGTALTTDGRLPLRRARYRDDLAPIEAGCPCAACERFSRAYLRHLFVCGELLAHRLLSLHNITHLARLMAGARQAIVAGTFDAYRAAAEARLPRAARDVAGFVPGRRLREAPASGAAGVGRGGYTSPS